MKKIHTRVKRRLGLDHNRKHYFALHPLAVQKHRPKTFKTEESAKNWTRLHGIAEGTYSLKKVKHNKKFQVVANG